MATAVHPKTFPAGSILRLTIKDKDGEVYEADKVFTNQKNVSGGKMLTVFS